MHFSGAQQVESSVEALCLDQLGLFHDAAKSERRGVSADDSDAHPGLAVEVVAGGQPHYPYVVSLE